MQFREKFLGPGGRSGGVRAGVEKIVVEGGGVHEVAVHGGEDGVDHLLEGVVEVGLPFLGIGTYPGLFYSRSTWMMSSRRFTLSISGSSSQQCFSSYEKVKAC